MGKTLALYFSAHWCPPCRSFTPNLSTDQDQEAFEEYYNNLPWLALPFADKTKKDLLALFPVRSIPSLIVVGPDGKTVIDNARSAVSTHGAKAYPFTDSHLERLEKEIEQMVEKSPKEMRYSQHKHPLVLTQRRVYVCDGCNEDGTAWCYYCKDCDCDLHVTCALKNRQDKGQDTDTALDENGKSAGVIYDGNERCSLNMIC